MADLGDVGRSSKRGRAMEAGGWTPDFSGARRTTVAAVRRARGGGSEILSGSASAAITTDVVLMLMREFTVVDRKAPVSGVVTFSGLTDGVYYAHSLLHSLSWRITVSGGSATVTALVSSGYPTVPVGTKLLVLVGGRLKAITP